MLKLLRKISYHATKLGNIITWFQQRVDFVLLITDHNKQPINFLLRMLQMNLQRINRWLETFVRHLLQHMHIIQNIGALLSIDFVLPLGKQLKPCLTKLLHLKVLIDDGQKIKKCHIRHLVLLEQIILFSWILFLRCSLWILLQCIWALMSTFIGWFIKRF